MTNANIVMVFDAINNVTDINNEQSLGEVPTLASMHVVRVLNNENEARDPPPLVRQRGRVFSRGDAYVDLSALINTNIVTTY